MPRKGRGQPISVAPGQEYGQRAAQESAQAAVPMAQQQSAIEAAQGFTPQVTPLGAPGSPGSPMTDGLPFGPGRNTPQPLGFKRPQELDAESAAKILPVLEVLSTRGDASPSTAMFVRRLRNALPPGHTSGG